MGIAAARFPAHTRKRQRRHSN